MIPDKNGQNLTISLRTFQLWDAVFYLRIFVNTRREDGHERSLTSKYLTAWNFTCCFDLLIASLEE
jgi:hypothetical protein